MGMSQKNKLFFQSLKKQSPCEIGFQSHCEIGFIKPKGPMRFVTVIGHPNHHLRICYKVGPYQLEVGAHN